MARSSFASVDIDVGEEAQEIPRPEPDTPFRILVAGDFSGGAGRNRKAIEVDRDNFDAVMARLAPTVRLGFGNVEVPLSFRELEDFHPDRLFERLSPFQALRGLRRRLADPKTFKETAAQLAPRPATSAGAPRNISGSDLLREMMGEPPEPAASAAAPAKSDFDRMLSEMVSKYVTAKDDPRQPEMIAQTDTAITEEMRAVLHHPAFQSLEAAWRGLYFLVRRLDTGEDLKIYVMDLPPEELLTPEGLGDLRRVALTEAAGTIGGVPWAVLVGLYSFSGEHEGVLSQIAGIARSAGAPFLSGLGASVVGLKGAFDELRRLPAARWVGLAMPRILLRMPYGKNSDETETFAFEEMTNPPEHERYLWGNPALACAFLLGESFSRYGWQMRPGALRDVDGLPLHLYEAEGEKRLKPCAEILLTEDAAEVLLDRGFIPVASIKDSDTVRVVRFQSIAAQSAPLNGRWM
ncbi:MAG TPA: type VI secretion system contractile sheath large subunit [Verrucomicrobiae bacterium]|nr:type VI secretion system contractile sheath large subunit [Verrucomicrobiae bacterium]